MTEEPTDEERALVARTIEVCEHSSLLDPCLDWGAVMRDTLARLRAACPSLLERFSIRFRREEGILDTHLTAVYEPRSAVERLADVVET